MRLAYFLEMRGRPLFEHLHLDPLYYWRWAVRVYEGRWLGEAVFEQSPLYAYLLGGLFRLWGAPSADLARLIGALAGSLTCVGIGRLGRHLEPRGGAWIAGLLAALYGPFVFYDLMVMKTFLAAALTVASALALARSEGRRPAALLLAGAVLGLAALVRENLLLVAPFALVWIALRGRNSPRRECARAVGAYLAGLLLATAPAALHNRWAGGEWVWITSGGGEVFYIGNHAQANGQYFTPPFVRADPEHEHEDFRAEARRRLGRPLSRGESSRYWFLEGLGAIRDRPLAWLGLEIRKALIFLNAYELPDNHNYQVLRRHSRVLRRLTFGFGLVAPLALVGLGLAGRRRGAAPIVLTLAAAFASTLLFFNFGRFRIPAAALMIPFAAATLREAGARARQGRWRSLAAGIGAPWAACLLLVNVNWLGAGRFTSAQDHLALAEGYRLEGKPALAEGEYREGLWLIPAGAAHPAAGRLRAGALAALARLAQERGETQEALEQLARAAQESPDPPQRAALLEERAALLWQAGQSAAALRDLEEARRHDPHRFRAAFEQAELLRRLGRLEEAEAILREAGERIPDEDRLAQANYHFALGRLLMADRKRPSEALPHLRRALELGPGHPQADEIRRMLEGGGGFIDNPPGPE